MIKGNTARRVAAAKAKTTTGKRGRPPKKKVETARPIDPLTPDTSPTAGFPVLFPEQLRTCLMSREDVEAAVRTVVKEIHDKIEEQNGQRRVSLNEAMERLHVDSRSTMWHWNDKGYLIKEYDKNGHVFYREYKIRRAERGEHPEGKVEEPGIMPKKGGAKHGKR